jgi:hypothetical protein
MGEWFRNATLPGRSSAAGWERWPCITASLGARLAAAVPV